MENKSAVEIRKIELDQYRQAVENLASSRSDMIFNNSSPDHAAIVLTAMLKHSNCEFRIYDNDLSGDISELNPEFFTNLSSFINLGKTVKIVIDSLEGSANSIAYETIINHKQEFPNTVKVAIASKTFKDNMSNIYGKKINFALGDKTSFRLEESSINTLGRKAHCCFNHPVLSQKLATVFDASFDTCQML